MERVKEIFEELTLNRQASTELEDDCYDIINAEFKTEEDYDIKEKAILSLAENYSKNRNIQKLKDLINKIQPVVLNIKKSKTAKLLRAILDMVSLVPDTLDIQSQLCEFLVNWCTKQNRNLLKQKIEVRHCHVLYQKKNYREALDLISPLLTEARKVDDKNLLVEIQLIESQVYFAIRSFAKAKSALTACRAAANSIYCAPLLQASIDLQSGVVNAQDKDFKTAYSYFFEAFEVYHQNDEKAQAIKAFQYMILCKMMINANDDARTLLNGKYGLLYKCEEIELIRMMADANREKSLKAFQTILEGHKDQVSKDHVIYSHIQNLYDNLLEQNLMKIVVPYSKVEISHIAELVNLKQNVVQAKLSEMILDKKFEGTLDQGNGCLIIFDEVRQGELYSSAMDTLDNMNTVVDRLFEKSKQLSNLK